MKSRFLIPLALIASVATSSCLKDTPYMDVSNSAPIIEFGLSPANGLSGTFMYAGDTASSPIIDTAIALLVASPQVLNYSVNITIGLDTSLISAFNTANSTNFTLLPDSLYTLSNTMITIQPGYRVGRIPVTFNFPSFPSPHTYALPLQITNGGGLIISGNSSTFMWLFQR